MNPVSTDEQGEPFIHSFVIRVWLEETDTDTREAVWRGHITHIPGDERKYLKDLSEIPTFIEGYLKFSSTIHP